MYACEHTHILMSHYEILAFVYPTVFISLKAHTHIPHPIMSHDLQCGNHGWNSPTLQPPSELWEGVLSQGPGKQRQETGLGLCKTSVHVHLCLSPCV